MNRREELDAEILAAEAAVALSDQRLRMGARRVVERGAVTGGVLLAVAAGAWLVTRLIPRRRQVRAQPTEVPVARTSLAAGIFGALWPMLSARLTGNRTPSGTDLALGVAVPVVEAILATRRGRRG